jgi:cold shock CspA family protein/ribosome-associated translation inhibitor RaiA
MQIPLKISFHNMDRSPAVEAAIREKTDKLQKFCPDMIRCQVEVEAPHRHHQQGNLYRVRLRITVPRSEIAVTRGSDEHHAHEDPYVAIRDAFRAARRQLEDYSRIQRGDVKSHAVPLHGRITSFDAATGFGVIVTADEREVSFHRHSVVDADPEQFKEGTEVRFNETAGEEGPVATTVHVVGKHHPVG